MALVALGVPMSAINLIDCEHQWRKQFGETVDFLAGHPDSIDSAVLGAMISGVKLARQADGDLRVVGCSGHVAEVLRLTQLDRVLTMCSGVDEAFEGD